MPRDGARELRESGDRRDCSTSISCRIKVDREERPDLDQIYMNAVQTMTGRGGWPMSVFLTPDLKPFYGGTYWPPPARMGMPGFDQVLAAVADAWQNRREAVRRAGRAIDRPAARRSAISRRRRGQLDRAELFDAARRSLERDLRSVSMAASAAPRNFRIRWICGCCCELWRRDGRAGNARRWSRSRSTRWPPAACTINSAAASIAIRSTSAGWCRTSRRCSTTTPCWPRAMSRPSRPPATRDYARVVRETLDYVLREMTEPAGGFYSTQDADSEGEEGKFFVWTPAEIEAVLGAERGQDVLLCLRRERHGQFRRARTFSICPRRSTNAPRSSAATRPSWQRNWPTAARNCWPCPIAPQSAPGLDDKVLVSWNGLMIDGVAQAGRRARRAALLRAGGEGRATSFSPTCAATTAGCCTRGATGRARFDAYLDDYACLANALVTLYEADFDERWIDEAVELADVMLGAIRRSRARRILLHGRRSRAADRPAEGHARQLDAQRQARWRPRRCCDWASCAAAAITWRRPSRRCACLPT